MICPYNVFSTDYCSGTFYSQLYNCSSDLCYTTHLQAHYFYYILEVLDNHGHRAWAWTFMDQTWTWAKAPLACSLAEYACGHVLAHLGARLGLHIAPERIAKARIGQVGLGRYHT